MLTILHTYTEELSKYLAFIPHVKSGPFSKHVANKYPKKKRAQHNI